MQGTIKSFLKFSEENWIIGEKKNAHNKNIKEKKILSWYKVTKRDSFNKYIEIPPKKIHVNN